MRRQLGDLIAQPIQFRDGSEGGADVCRTPSRFSVDLHGDPMQAWAVMPPHLSVRVEHGMQRSRP
jgi:hypothetical protein